MANEANPKFTPTQKPTCSAGAAVTGKRFVKVSGVPVTNLTRIAHAGAGEKVFGVSPHDIASGDTGAIYGPGWTVPVTTGANVTAGAELESGAAGVAIPLASGKVAGIALDDATSGNDVLVRVGP